VRRVSAHSPAAHSHCSNTNNHNTNCTTTTSAPQTPSAQGNLSTSARIQRTTKSSLGVLRKGTLLRAVSTRPAHAAQLMPPTASTTVVAGGLAAWEPPPLSSPLP
jgi:hypothetical protein